MKGALSIRRLKKPPAEIAESPQTDPAGGAINGGKQVRALVRVRHLWQIVDVYMHEARLIRLRGCLGTHFRNSLKIGRLDKINPLF